MSDQQLYEAVMEEVRVMPDSEATRPPIPADIFIHEALRLYEWAGQDREVLESRGMNWQLVEDLATRAAALRHAQALWVSERFTTEEARQVWAERSPEAYDLRDTLLHTYRFVFRRNPELLRVVDMIAAGNSHVDMLQDLKDLSLTGRRSANLLAEVMFDMTLLSRAEELAEELSRVYAEARNDRLSYREAKLTRDKIATLLKQSVDEVRAYGQYVFWRNGQRRTGYTSEYHRHTGKAANPPAAPQAPETPEEPNQV